MDWVRVVQAIPSAIRQATTPVALVQAIPAAIAVSPAISIAALGRLHVSSLHFELPKLVEAGLQRASLPLH